ncbi:hypothetical protein CEXT_407641 [Caerostris extrusa]|uniref:Uncharacterized protein n=1 Tax=Caerostris extrusa TaxID=172846 RepID=A0AAV4TMC0_CAEEX|nr:hypothetical protein CEXT_407641 [Caerostris extrusa]
MKPQAAMDFYWFTEPGVDDPKEAKYINLQLRGTYMEGHLIPLEGNEVQKSRKPTGKDVMLILPKLSLTKCAFSKAFRPQKRINHKRIP